MIEPTLMELVKRAQGGDARAFEGIVRATLGLVYSQVVAILRDRQKAEDATQEVFLAAWKSLATLKETDGFIGWLSTLARNRALDTVKFENRLKRKVEPRDGNPGLGGGGPLEALEKQEATERALRMLEELPEDYRRPLMMRYLGGCDHETIRRALGVSDGALRGQLARGMARLREMIKVEK